MPALAAVDAPPAQVARRLAALRAALDAETGLPACDGAHLLIGTFNIRAFGGLTAAWDRMGQARD
jgi:adenosylcobinamide amidohydrolase